MRVLITGAAGLVGTAVVREFLEQGYEVCALDIKPVAAEFRERVETVYADIADKNALLKASEGCGAIVHLAALGSMYMTEDRVFHTNVIGTQRVLATAEVMGIERVAIASSNCALGMLYSDGKRVPQYLPVDELHPTLADDYYGLSKIVDEQTAAGFARRGKMTIVSLRLCNVLNFKRGPQYQEWQRRRLVEQIDLRYNDLWAYIFQEDAARAFRLAIEAPLQGHHVIHVSAKDSYTVHDVRELVRKNLPELADSCDKLEPRQSLYDLTQAKEKLGFSNTKSWRDMPELAAVENAEPEPEPES